MTGHMTSRWVVRPSTPPQPLRHCGTCAQDRPFASSGKMRLNANGRRLDAWLIYKCAACDRTWNRPILERVSVHHVPAQDMEAMQHSRADWVAGHEYDVGALRKYCDRIAHTDQVVVIKPPRPDWPASGQPVTLDLHVPDPTGWRLDRLIARELGLTRSRVQRLVKAGAFAVANGDTSRLRKPLTSDITLQLMLDSLQQEEWERVWRALWA